MKGSSDGTGEVLLIELTVGAIAAALIAKALDRAGNEAVDQGEGVLRRLVQAVRDRLSGADSPDGVNALIQIEEAPGSRRRVEALARVLDEYAEEDPEFRRELAALVEESERAGMDVKSTVQVAYGSQSLQLADISDSEINISFGDGENRVRRISD